MRKMALVFGVPLLVIAFILSLLHSERHEPGASAAIAAAYVPSALELADRASVGDIVAACGKPDRQWMTTSGTGEYEQDTQHLWYSGKKAEVYLTAAPHNRHEQFRYWVYSGTYRSPSSQVEVDGAELAKRMPCMKRWTDAWAAAGQQSSRQSLVAEAK